MRYGKRARKKRQNPETAITKQIREVLRKMKVPHFKHWGGPFGSKGISDLIGTLPPDGRSLYIEVKTQVGHATHDQMNFLRGMQSAGAVAFVARSWREVVSELADRGFAAAQELKKRFDGGDDEKQTRKG